MSNSLQEGCRTSDLGYNTVVLMSCQLLTIGEVWIVTYCCWPELLNVGPFQKPSSLSTGSFAYTKRICIMGPVGMMSSVILTQILTPTHQPLRNALTDSCV